MKNGTNYEKLNFFLTNFYSWSSEFELLTNKFIVYQIIIRKKAAVYFEQQSTFAQYFGKCGYFISYFIHKQIVKVMGGDILSFTYYQSTKRICARCDILGLAISSLNKDCYS